MGSRPNARWGPRPRGYELQALACAVSVNGRNNIPPFVGDLLELRRNPTVAAKCRNKFGKHCFPWTIDIERWGLPS